VGGRGGSDGDAHADEGAEDCFDHDTGGDLMGEPVIALVDADLDEADTEPMGAALRQTAGSSSRRK